MPGDSDLVRLAMQMVQSEQSHAQETSPQLKPEPNPKVPEPPPHFNLKKSKTGKEFRTAEQLGEMVLSDLRKVDGCPETGLKVTVYGLDPWNAWLQFEAAAGPVRNKQELLDFCELLTDRLKLRYDILDAK